MAEAASRAARLARAAAAPAAAGLVSAAGHPPLDAVWLALPGFTVALALFLRTSGWRQGFGFGWAFGTGYFALSLVWIVQPFLVDPARHGWMAPFALVLMAGGLALFWGAALALASLARHRLPAAVLALTLAELARTYVLTGFPWAAIGHAWIGWPVMQLAAYGGASALALAMLAPAALAASLRPAGVASGLALVILLVTLAEFRGAAPLPDDTGTTVRVVQPNVEQSLKWDAETAGETFDRLLRLTAAAPAGPAPDLIVWPETALPYLYDGPGPLIGEVSAAAGGRPMLIGAIRVDGMRAYNSVVEIGAGGVPGEVYDKHHPVPFGEYIPFAPVLSRIGLRAFTAREGYGYTAGPGPRLIDMGPLGRTLPLICYEAIFPQSLRGTPRPDWLVQVTNDAWFGTFSGPYQHLAQARLRAVEQGLPLVRAANTGVSAVIDPQGRVLARLPLGTEGFLDVRLPAALPGTLYATTGDLPGALLLAGLLAGLLLRRRGESD